MEEFKMVEGRIQLDDDAVTLIFKGWRVPFKKRAASPRKIPYSAIVEVEKYSHEKYSSYLKIVISGKPNYKLRPESDVDCVIFQADQNDSVTYISDAIKSRMAGALARPEPSLLPPRRIDPPLDSSMNMFAGPQEILFIEWKGNKRLTSSPVKCLCKACSHRWTVPASAANSLAQQQALGARLNRKGNKDMHEGAQGLIFAGSLQTAKGLEYDRSEKAYSDALAPFWCPNCSELAKTYLFTK